LPCRSHSEKSYPTTIQDLTDQVYQRLRNRGDQRREEKGIFGKHLSAIYRKGRDGHVESHYCLVNLLQVEPYYHLLSSLSTLGATL
jgi:hypothetical protein